MSPAKLRILRAIRDEKPLNLARDWVDLVELANTGHIDAVCAPNGQLNVGALTDLGRAAITSSSP